MDIIWLFFMLSALQPIIKQKLLEASRKRMIGLIERERKSRVVLLVHRQETMSLLGFPVFRYIDINDSEDRSGNSYRPGAAHAWWFGFGGDANRARHLRSEWEGHSICSALRHVRRHLAGARR